MAFFPSGINKNHVIELIQQGNINELHNTIRSRLYIDDVDYQIIFEDYSFGNDCFGDEFSKARTIPNEDWNRAEKVVFYVENIANLMNDRFSKLPM